MKKTFKCNIPATLKKSKNGEWIVEGLASTEDKDLQGEIIKQKGIDLEAIKRGKGILNFEHSNEAGDVVGKITEAWHTKKGLMIRAYLLKNSKKAKQIYNAMSSLRKEDKDNLYSLSVEGKIAERSGKDGKVIKRAIIDRVAVTSKPVNVSTYLGLVKSLSVVSSPLNRKSIKKAIIKKALEAGYSQVEAPEARSGGGALVKEHIDTGKKEKKDRFKGLKNLGPSLEQLWGEISKKKK